MPANEDFRDFLLRRGHMLARYENGVVRDMMVPYHRARGEVYSRLRRLEELALTGVSPTRDFMITRLRGQLADIDGILHAAALESAGTLETALAEFAHSESDVYVNMLRGTFNKVGISINDLPFRQIDFALQEPLIYQYRGMTIPESMLWTNQEAITAIRTELTQSIIQGEDMRRATNRLIGTGRGFGGAAGALITSKANIIARTEIQHISNEVSRAVYRENQDVLKGASYVATLDRRICLMCSSTDGTVYLYRGRSDHNGPIIPRHPFCFIDYQVPIYTSRGIKRIGDIKKGDLVLTHKGRFKKVTEIIRHKIKQPHVVSIWVQYPKLSGNRKFKPHRKRITVTCDHPLFINGSWIAAKDIKKGDKFKYLATKCKRCKKTIPYDKKYCSQSCTSKDITDRQWSDPKHRKNVSEKNSKSMLDQYASGKRDPYIITEKALKEVKKLYDKGIHPFQTQDMRGDKNPAKRTEVRKIISEGKMGDKNPMRMYPHIAKENGRRLSKFLIENPDKHPNRIMSLRGHETGIEKKFREEMEGRGLEFEKQHPILKYFADFALPELMIAIEVDGEYWHSSNKAKRRDKKRQKQIEAEGWTVLRYGERRINNGVDECVDELCRIINNHSRIFKFMELEVVEVKHWNVSGRGVSRKGKEHIKPTTLYNISVEDDESYIANGFVSHNCRCFYSPVTYSWKELARRHGVPFSNTQQDYFTGRTFDIITYNQWFSGLKSAEQLDILGPTRYNAWVQGKLKLTEMATQRKILTLRELGLTTKRGVSAEVPSALVKVPKGVKAKMSATQLRAVENYVPVDKEVHTIASTAQANAARKFGLENVLGNRPFDMFFENEFIEHKAFVTGRGQIRMRAASRKKKEVFVKQFGVRPHTIVTDMRPTSPTFGKLFYRKGLGDFKVATMMEIRTEAQLKSLIKKGARKDIAPPPAVRKIKPSTTITQAENYAKTELGILEVDYGGISTKAADSINKHLAGAIDSLEVKPTKLIVNRPKVKSRFPAVAFDDGIIYLDAHYFDKIEDIVDNARDYFKVGHFSTAAEGHIIRHEVGHLKYFNIGGTEALSERKLSKRMIAELKQGIGPLNLKEHVSKYALVSEGEFYAEMIAKVLNGELLHPVVRKIMRRIETNLKRGITKKVVDATNKGVRAQIKAGKLTPLKIVVKKNMNQLRYSLRTGRIPKKGSNILKTWERLSTTERLGYIDSWKKAGILIPDILKKGAV